MLPALRVGGLYEARVARLMPGGRVRIVLSGETLAARAETSMREGDELTVEVVRLHPELVLRVAHPPGKKPPCG